VVAVSKGPTEPSFFGPEDRNRTDFSKIMILEKSDDEEVPI
jgi:hypothetical protein